jgi:hypothetical protein
MGTGARGRFVAMDVSMGTPSRVRAPLEMTGREIGRNCERRR